MPYTIYIPISGRYSVVVVVYLRSFIILGDKQDESGIERRIDMSMTIEQAKSELMQIYGALSPDKQRAIDTLVKIEPCEDAIPRTTAITLVNDVQNNCGFLCYADYEYLYDHLSTLPSVNPQEPKWIPVSEGLPEDLEAVNISWVNHNPESYYMDIKDKPFTATGHYCKGRWYWYSSTCQDYLKEYGRCDVDEIDTDIEVTAWMPLPKPYKAESEE